MEIQDIKNHAKEFGYSLDDADCLNILNLLLKLKQFLNK